MKGIRYLLFTFVVICLSCSKKPQDSRVNQWMQENNKLKVLSTTAIVGDLVAQVGQDEIDHLVLIHHVMDPHSYELVKGDAEKIERADLIFSNGLGLEHGASLSYALTHHRNHIPLGDHLAQNSSSILHLGGDIDPHIWMDVSLWSDLVDYVQDTLAQLIPEKSSVFAQNAKALKENLLELDQHIFALMQQVPENKRFLVTSHDAFNYFARRYLVDAKGNWKQRFCAPEGLAPDGQLGISDIHKIVNHLTQNNIHIVFPESNVAKDSLRKIQEVAKKKNLKVSLCTAAIYGDALGEKGSDAETYFDMMYTNAKTLSYYLNQEG